MEKAGIRVTGRVLDEGNLKAIAEAEKAGTKVELPTDYDILVSGVGVYADAVVEKEKMRSSKEQSSSEVHT